MTCVTVGAATGPAAPITSVTVLAPGFEIHRLPAESIAREPGTVLLPAGSMGVVKTAAPALVSAVTVPLFSVTQVTLLPSMASCFPVAGNV